MYTTILHFLILVPDFLSDPGPYFVWSLSNDDQYPENGGSFDLWFGLCHPRFDFLCFSI